MSTTSQDQVGKAPTGRSAAGLLLLLALMFVPSLLFAQQQVGRITGRVVDSETGAPLSQVQVFIQSLSIGALSRTDGQFLLLNVPVGTHEVRAERIGMGATTQQVTVSAGAAVTVTLSLSTVALGLDEIVVTGTAGASRRREIGNTISQITVADLPSRPLTVGDALQSQAPGVQLLTGSGELGSASMIRLRGVHSLSGNTQPIVYIDGVRTMSGAGTFGNSPEYSGRASGVVPGALDQINPNDIERIEVIKGSAATTLYGTEASNGVIQIFTKRGAAGRAQWSFETQQKVAWIPKFSVEPEPYARMEPWLSNGHHQQYTASVKGGGAGLEYFTSGQMQTATGNLPSDSLTQWNVRGNFTFAPQADLRVNWNTAYSNRFQKNTPTDANAQSIVLNTWRAEANYFGTDDPAVVGQLLSWEYDNVFERFTTGGTATFSPIAPLTNRLTIGYDMALHEVHNMRPYGFALFTQGGLMVEQFRVRNLNFDYVGSLNFPITNSVRSTFSWGGQAVGTDESTTGQFGESFPGAANPTVNSAARNQGFESREKVWNAGFFIQNVFDVSNRYFVTVGARVDGNSTFGSGFGLQVYPKASLSWVASDESWWPESLGTLKLRSAYGLAGRAPGAFDAVRTWSLGPLNGVPGFVPGRVGNPDIGPEVTGELEVGFDGSWLNDRISSTVTYFQQVTTDAIVGVPQTPSIGFTSSQPKNIGKAKNSGVEVALNGSVVRGSNFGWDLGASITTNHSEVLSAGGVISNTIIVGQPIGVRQGKIVTNPDAIAAPIYRENVVIGPSQPTLTLAGNTSVRLPYGVLLATRGEYKGGHWIQDNYFSIDRGVRSPLCYPYYVYPKGIIEEVAGTPGARRTSVAVKPDTPALWRARCTPGLENGAYWWKMDFFRLRNITATVPLDFALPDRMTGAMLTLGIDNVYLWRKDLPFGDPEAGGTISNETTGATGGMGIGYHRLPQPRSVYMNLRFAL